MESPTKAKALHVFAEIGDNGNLHSVVLNKKQQDDVEEAIKRALGGSIPVREKPLESVYVQRNETSDD